MSFEIGHSDNFGFYDLDLKCTYPKIVFRLNISLHLFEAHCAVLPHFNLNLDLLQVVKVTKSGRHLLHDRESKRYGSMPGLTSQISLHSRL